MFVDSGAITGFRSFAFLVFFSLFLVSIRFFYHFTDYRTDVALVNVSAKISIYNQIYVEIVERVRAHTWFFMFGGSCEVLLILPSLSCLSGNEKRNENCLLPNTKTKKERINEWMKEQNSHLSWGELKQTKVNVGNRNEMKHRKNFIPSSYYSFHI